MRRQENRTRVRGPHFGCAERGADFVSPVLNCGRITEWRWEVGGRSARGRSDKVGQAEIVGPFGGCPGVVVGRDVYGDGEVSTVGEGRGVGVCEGSQDEGW